MNAVSMAGGVNIGTGLVDCGVDQESGGVHCRLVSILQNVTLFINMDHVGGLHETVVHSDRVDPEGVGIDGVSDGNVAGRSLSVSLSAHDSERSCHVL